MATETGHPTLVHAFKYWAEKRPNAVYMTQPYPDGRVVDYSWGEVSDQARRMAAWLKSLELPEKSHIAIVGKNSAHWIMADLAIWMAGHVSIPLYPTINADTAKHVFEHSEAKLLFVGKLDGINDTWNEFKHGIPDDLPRVALPMSPLPDADQWEDLVAATEPLPDIPLPTADDMATIIYTSGSTGRPKGVMHSFSNMVHVARGMRELFNVSVNDRMLSYLPLAHAAERAGVETGSLYSGFHVFFAGNLDTFQQDLKRARPTIFFSVPRLWTKFYQGVQQKLSLKKQRLLFPLPVVGRLVRGKLLGELGLDHVRIAATGSAPLAPDILKWYRRLGLELLEVYAMSENFAYSHFSQLGKMRIGYVGNAAPGVEARIDPDTGELQIKSPGQMLGYFKQPEKTAEDMTDDGFFKTGDMGEIDAQGRLKITGRVKELFKTSKGKYVAPAPIENLLANHPDIEVACVTGVEQPQPYALLMLAEERQQEQQNGKLDKKRLDGELRELLKQTNIRLEHHEQLAFMVVVKDAWTMEEGFLTPTMRIKRNIIEKRYAANADQWFAMKQPAIWE